MRSFLKVVICLCLLVLAFDVLAAIICYFRPRIANHVFPLSFLVLVATTICEGCAAIICAMRRDWRNGKLAIVGTVLGLVAVALWCGLVFLVYAQT